MQQFQTYDIRQLIFDNASENTGAKGGLGVLFKTEREKDWQKNEMPGQLPNLILKGCDDHIANLASVDFGKRVVEILEEAGFNSLIVGKASKKDPAAATASKIAKTLLRGPYSRLLHHFCMLLCGRSPHGELSSKVKY